MATTLRTDLVKPEVLQDAIAAGLAGASVFDGSPVAVVNPQLPDVKGGDEVTMPYFANLGRLERVTEGNGLTARKLTMSSEKGYVDHYGMAVELTEWAKIAAHMFDPVGQTATQFSAAAVQQIQVALVAAAKTNFPAGMIRDVFNQVTPRGIDWDAIVEAKQKWGDEQESIEMLAVHSDTYGDLQKLKTTDGVPLLTMPADGSIPRFCGIPVTVSDLLLTDHPTVVATGTSPPTVTIDGESNNADVRIEITTLGARGTSVFKYSLDGGTTWATGITTAAAVVLGTSGLTANFANATSAVDNVYVAKPRHQTLLLKKGALVAWFNAKPSVQQFHDVTKDADMLAIHLYFVAYRYSVLQGKTRGGVAMLRHN